MNIYEEHDYDFEWQCVVEMAALDDREVVAHYEQIVVNLGLGVGDVQQRTLHKAVKSEVILRLEVQTPKGDKYATGH